MAVRTTRPRAHQGARDPQGRHGRRAVRQGRRQARHGRARRPPDRQGFEEAGSKYGSAAAHRAAGDVAVVVEGINIAKRHTKPRQRPGRPTACPRSSRAASSTSPSRCRSARSWSCARSCGKPTRIAHATLDDGRRVRVCRHCGEQLEVEGSDQPPARSATRPRSCRRSRSSSSTATRCRCRGSTRSSSTSAWARR